MHTDGIKPEEIKINYACALTQLAGADETIKEGDLVETRDFNYKALTDSKLVLVYEN